MKKTIEYLHHLAAPAPETLWERGGAQPKNVEIEPGRFEEVPFFDVEIAGIKDTDRGTIVDANGDSVGDFQTYSVKTSDGIDRTARVYVPYDKNLESANMVMHADTAWFTTIDGHNNYAASNFVSKTGLPMIFVGAEHGTTKHSYPKEFARVPQTARNATTISLAKSAQSSQLITTELLERYDLPKTMIKTGESRGAMLTAGHYGYAKYYGNEIIYGDVTAPCIPKRMFGEQGDLLRLIEWPTAEAMGMIALGLDLVKQRTLRHRIGTVALNPNFIVSNIVGVGPALFSGEAGHFTRWVPRSLDQTSMYVSTFRNDLVSRPDVWNELYDEHDNVYIREHRSGTHMTLAGDDVLASKALRINAMRDFHETQGHVTPEQWRALSQARKATPVSKLRVA